ncbi:MAG TPA: hypothetical protein VFH23_04190 [Jiangellaceae bacterium]|nr:hypothetical protein [Jiangellaceae bacterium]
MPRRRSPAPNVVSGRVRAEAAALLDTTGGIDAKKDLRCRIDGGGTAGCRG